MPAQQPGAQIPKKKVIYSQAEIDQLAAYVASLGAGPTVPTKNQVSPEGADIANGGELFRTNCAQCHNFTGEGGALTHGKFAPSLEGVSPKHIYEAMQTGPQNMPSFPDTTMPEKSKKDIIAYINAVNGDDTESPGGLNLGGLGPVSEGLFAWIFGLGALVAVAVWVAARTAKAKKS
jgi:ubiquinol-cytochrome c reductase cytochrome c subunit